MATTATRSIQIAFTGDLSARVTFNAAANADSPGQIENKALSSGANTITPPSGVTPKAVTLVPPSGNTVLITLKGVSGDTGVALHKTDPTTIALDSPSNTFVLNAASTVSVRLIWS